MPLSPDPESQAAWNPEEGAESMFCHPHFYTDTHIYLHTHTHVPTIHPAVPVPSYEGISNSMGNESVRDRKNE